MARPHLGVRLGAKRHPRVSGNQAELQGPQLRTVQELCRADGLKELVGSAAKLEKPAATWAKAGPISDELAQPGWLLEGAR